MALPLTAPDPAHRVVARLAGITPGPCGVVSCYLKLEPRDKTRGKYLIKMKNRVKQAVADLARQPLARDQRVQVADDLARVLQRVEEPGALPQGRGVAIFASSPLGLFETLALPRVFRSRLAVAPLPLIRELLALEEEFGTILVVAADRASARCFAVTAFDVEELPGVFAEEVSRAGKYHGQRQAVRGGLSAGAAGEYSYHHRIREEKQRHYANVADLIYRIHQQRPLAGLVLAGIGVDAGAVLPHLHTYLHDLVLGVVKMNPKHVGATEVREAALLLREERDRVWERTHAAAVRDGLGTGWAVNGVEATLKALERGQVRTLLADGEDDDPRLDDAVEEALHQRAQVNVVYDPRARRGVDGLAALLRFRR
ncbi:MAG TPA: hypothetical protein VFK78_11015 [Gemmatimonadales bacterium]|nr:hypothetical protein [Gemmatimonadales bacterium]